MVDMTVEARNNADDPGLVKLQGETWELNVWATTDELRKLATSRRRTGLNGARSRSAPAPARQSGGTNTTAR